MAKETSKQRGSVSFTIDGRMFELESERALAADLLRLAGLDPSGYDLSRLRKGQAEPKRFEDEDEIHIKGEDRFASIRQEAQVA